MTSKKGSRHGRYSKSTTPTSQATTSTDKATGSSGKTSTSSGKDRTSSSKTSTSTTKATTPSDKATTSGSKGVAPINKSKKPASKVTVSTSKEVMPSSDFSHMRHRFYIVRPEPNKICVPMIAVDELPGGFRLEGIPLTVTPQQINEWDMARVGADVTHKDSFEVECDRLSPSKQSQQPFTGVENSSSPEKTEVSTDAGNVTVEVNRDDNVETSSKPDVSMNSSRSFDGETSKVKSKVEGLASVLKLHQEVNEAVHGVVEKSSWEKANHHSKTQDAATPGVFGKKKYCTHWIRTGNCDYMQEGCRYLHVIPDAETRLTIGIRDMPRWAKEDLPSPPRETSSLRRRSWSPPKAKGEAQKDWRSRGNRKFHAELPAGPPLVSRVASERPSTPTPQSTFHGKKYRPQQGMMENGGSHASVSAQGKSPASQLPNLNQNGNFNVQGDQQNSFSSDPSIAAPRPMSNPVAPSQPASLRSAQQASNSQSAFAQHPQYMPSVATGGPRVMQPPPAPAGFYSAYSSPDHETHPFGPPYDEGNYNPFQSHQSPRASPFDNGNFRNDGHRWGHPSHSPFGMNGHNYPQSHPTPPPGSPFGGVWRRGPFASPVPSFSEASVGTIGHGRPGASPSVMGTPILHKRLFRQPGESQYVQAQPLPSGTSRNGGQFHKGKGTATTYNAPNGDVSRSAELGNLISLDEEGNFGSN